MKKIHLGTSFTVFLLFFGVAILEAFQSGEWIMVLVWAVFGMLFLLADNFKKDGSL